MATFAVQYEYDHRADVRDSVRPSHRAFLAGLIERGVLLASGPWLGSTVGAGGSEPGVHDEAPGALLIVRAESGENALAVLDDDPFWTAGLISGRTARGWDPVLGPWSA